MLVKECMTRHPIMISPSTKVIEAQQLMTDNNIRHLPVASDGKRLEGLVTRGRLALKPDVLGSLNLWEISRQLGTLSVKDVMVKQADILTIEANHTIERAAKMMATHKVGCLPVVDKDSVIEGIISEVDVLHSYQELMGLPASGLRVTVRMPNRKGEFAKLMKVLSDNDWGVMGIGTYPTHRREGFYDVVLKIPEVTAENVQAAFNQIEDQEVVDIRDVV